MGKVGELNKGDIGEAASLLAQNFADDLGMLDILGEKNCADPRRLTGWFHASLELLVSGGGTLLGVRHLGALVGVIVLGAKDAPPVLTQIKWLVRTLSVSGVGAAIRTISHDAKRRKTLPKEKLNIVEFVAVSKQMRGKGIARLLFDAAHMSGGLFWLETVRKENLQIFAKLGYEQVCTHKERGVTYFVMENTVSIK